MTLSLADVWELDPEEIAIILKLEDQKLSDNLKFDRVVAATILYNHGKLNRVN